jgi:hypothetical protein
MKTTKKDQKELLQLLAEENQPKLLRELSKALEVLLKDKASLIEVKNKSSLKTLAYMITAADIV